jgi:hypothetical protein
MVARTEEEQEEDLDEVSLDERLEVSNISLISGWPLYLLLLSVF